MAREGDSLHALASEFEGACDSLLKNEGPLPWHKEDEGGLLPFCAVCLLGQAPSDIEHYSRHMRRARRGATRTRLARTVKRRGKQRRTARQAQRRKQACQIPETQTASPKENGPPHRRAVSKAGVAALLQRIAADALQRTFFAKF